MKIYDISRKLHEGIAVWPGDVPFRFELTGRMADGQPANVGAIATSLHVGTHVDAPYHMDPEGRTIGEMEPDLFVGTAVVVEAVGVREIGSALLEAVEWGGAKRVLVRTGGWQDPAAFPDSLPVIAQEVPEYLASRGVVLLGVDVPSVDAVESTDLPIHRALARFGIHILESLDLASVPAGVYELIALPLPLQGADASPVRAVLRELQGQDEI
jgi:arylformamidase